MLFEVLPNDLVFEVLAVMPAPDVSRLMTTCKAAAKFTAGREWYYAWVARRRGHGQAMCAAVVLRDGPGLRRLLALAPRGYDVNGPVGEGVGTLLQFAAGEGHVRTLKQVLRLPGVDVNGGAVLPKAVRGRWHGSLGALLRWPGVDPNARDEFGFTALHLACALDDKLAVELLVRHPRTDVNAAMAGGTGHRPLHMAVHWGAMSAEIIGELLRHPRVDVGGRDKWGDTALHTAALARAPDAVAALLADPRVVVSARNDRGETALRMVARHLSGRGGEVARLLLRAPGVDVHV